MSALPPPECDIAPLLLQSYWKWNIGSLEVAPQQQLAGCSICVWSLTCTQPYLTTALGLFVCRKRHPRVVLWVFHRLAVLNAEVYCVWGWRRPRRVPVTTMSLGRKQSGPPSSFSSLNQRRLLFHPNTIHSFDTMPAWKPCCWYWFQNPELSTVRFTAGSNQAFPSNQPA